MRNFLLTVGMLSLLSSCGSPSNLSSSIASDNVNKAVSWTKERWGQGPVKTSTDEMHRWSQRYGAPLDQFKGKKGGDGQSALTLVAELAESVNRTCQKLGPVSIMSFQRYSTYLGMNVHLNEECEGRPVLGNFRSRSTLSFRVIRSSSLGLHSVNDDDDMGYELETVKGTSDCSKAFYVDGAPHMVCAESEFQVYLESETYLAPTQIVCIDDCEEEPTAKVLNIKLFKLNVQ